MHNEHAGEPDRLAAKLTDACRDWASVRQEERLNLVRRYHHEISADMVLASVRNGVPPINFMLQDQDYPAEIAAVCEAHCVDTASPRYDELTRRAERSTWLRGLRQTTTPIIILSTGRTENIRGSIPFACQLLAARCSWGGVVGRR
jgi:hypothetical protein